ncbi:prephenate dehydratase [Sporomusa sphaeroides]|uniref:Prephenate dehydratase n=2 Tax=Sporomusa TaxID=2375 RepID=A0ABP2C850_9FIRM|nr:prephenate dehydratase [Sporomusa sphaeroides]OLS58687.1 prephenate dehydratase [Sporomusa sphaeroides DSM 2875]CVK19803.1 Prephenate dehydratase [Sporomusa sphaeroides DSM 2875]SCM79850.1 Prephenate dehydratase [uncultured Sporomusa sp.]
MLRKVGFLGPSGTYSEEIALSLYHENEARLEPFSAIDAAIRAVAAGEVDESIVPVENSLEGSVNITLDTLAHDVDLYITKEVVLPVRHSLLTKKDGNKNIAVIVSHPQALAQCRKTLGKLYPQAKLQPVDSTAEAARIVAAGDGRYAAVGSAKAAEIYGLKILAGDIQDNIANSTRFISLERQPVRQVQGNCKTSLVCQINGLRPGSLYNILQEFAAREVNLTRIESRPARTGLGLYIFFLDMEGSTAESNIAGAVKAIEEKCLWYKNLGSYPVYHTGK